MLLLTLSAAIEPQSSVVASASWIELLITGPLGTSLAMIAVAWFGLALLGGRLSFRRGGLLVLGCFILFRAPTIARELMGLAGRGGGQIAAPELSPAAPLQPPPLLPPQPDPYAGASVPNRN
jgi:type IV secretory pathway VirB2 component (pilin)